MQRNWMTLLLMGLMLTSCGKKDEAVPATKPEPVVEEADPVIVAAETVRVTLSEYDRCVAVHRFEGQMYSKRALANPRFQHDEVQRCVQMKLMSDALKQVDMVPTAVERQQALRKALATHNVQSEPQLAAKIGVDAYALGEIVDQSLLMPTMQRMFVMQLSDDNARKMFATDYRRYTVELADFDNAPSPEDVESWLKSHEDVFSAYIGVHQELMLTPPHAKFVRMAYGYGEITEMDAARVKAASLRGVAIRDGLDGAIGACAAEAGCEVLNGRESLYDVERTDALSWAFRMPVGGVSEVIHADGREEVWILQEVVPPQKRNAKDAKDRDLLGKAVMQAVEPSPHLMALLKPALEADAADLKSVTEANGGRYRLFREMTHLDFADRSVMESERVLKVLAELKEGETLLYSNPIIDNGRVYIFRVIEIAMPSEADFEAHKAEWQTRKIADKSYSLVVSWLDKAIPKLVSLNIKPVQEKYGVLQPNGTIR
ncbi:MAG: peptidyl-prolyl cis-trans isomerase [Proteobacteria bacterium]|nr:peptidyl-prolyl cis-trans isomerase [Pseudomonadota bacterium]